MSNETEEEDPRETPLHPRHASNLTGHEKAQQKLLEAYTSGRFHHAWLITGSQGIGKATLAYRLAKYIFTNPDQTSAPSDSLQTDGSHPAIAQMSARAHPDLLVVQRLQEKGKLKQGITVESTRKAGSFFSQTAASGNWRICIIDAADDMNIAAANSVLKILEEPPANSVFILICHNRGRLLPTILSRCIELPLSPLSVDKVSSVLDGLPDGAGKKAIKHAGLAAGSPGLALSLAETGAGEVFATFAAALDSNRLDFSTRTNIANALHGKGTDDRFNVFCSLMNAWINNAVKGAIINNASSTMVRSLAEAHEKIGHSIRETNALNLDRRLTMMQAFELIDQARRA